MKEIFAEMERKGILTKPEGKPGDEVNPLQEISCGFFVANMANFKKGQLGFNNQILNFKGNPMIYLQLQKHLGRCIGCKIEYGKFFRES